MDLDNSVGAASGIGCTVINLTGGFYPRDLQQPGTLVRTRSGTPISITGGRFEHVSILVNSWIDRSREPRTIALREMEITALGWQHAKPLILFAGEGNRTRLLVENSVFIGFPEPHAPQPFRISLDKSSAQVKFVGCHFQCFSHFDQIYDPSGGARIEIIDCLLGGIPTATLDKAGALLPYSKAIGSQVSACFAGRGRLENLLLHSDFGIRSSDTKDVGASLPWVHTGRKPHFELASILAPRRGTAAKRHSVLVRIGAQSGIYQDIDLGEEPQLGEHVIAYRCLLGSMGNSRDVSVRSVVAFRLEDSIVSDIVYDSVRIVAQSSPNKGPLLIELKRATATPVRRARIAIENEGSTSIDLVFCAQQLVCSAEEIAFVETADMPVRGMENWDVAVRNFNVADRLAIPYKFDQYGSEASLDELQSDIYISQTDEHLTYRAAGRWWKVPREIVGMQQPMSGSYKAGDFVRCGHPTLVDDRILFGWYRLTDGALHESGVDWRPVLI